MELTATVEDESDDDPHWPHLPQERRETDLVDCRREKFYKPCGGIHQRNCRRSPLAVSADR